MSEHVVYPGAVRPHRRRRVEIGGGLTVNVVEWGEPDAPPLFLHHGGFDFAGTFDVFAPMLAAEGWRVVAWDQRGHGDSDHAPLYSWDADVRDLHLVVASTTDRPAPMVGHSKGAGLLLSYAQAMPHRVSHLVNLDGLPSRRRMPDVHDHERTRLLAGELEQWLDHRRVAALAERRPGTLDQLAARRQRMNPRLPFEWLRYLVTVGARRDHDGWRWKIDPSLRLGGFGPWRPEWMMHRIAGLTMPVLAVLGLQEEEMGWGTLPEDVQPFLPPGARLEVYDDVGHFVHIEQPRRIADLVLSFLDEHAGATAGTR